MGKNRIPGSVLSKKEIRFLIALTVLICATYLVSWLLPVAQVHTQVNESSVGPTTLTYYGRDAFTEDWFRVTLVPQSANIALFVGLIFLHLRRYTVARIVSITSILAAGSAPFIYGIAVTSLRAGYYCWISSMVLLGIATVLVPQSARGNDSTAIHKV